MPDWKGLEDPLNRVRNRPKPNEIINSWDKMDKLPLFDMKKVFPKEKIIEFGLLETEEEAFYF